MRIKCVNNIAVKHIKRFFGCTAVTDVDADPPMPHYF